MSQNNVADHETDTPKNEEPKYQYPLTTPEEDWFTGIMIVLCLVAGSVAFVAFVVATFKYGF